LFRTAAISLLLFTFVAIPHASNSALGNGNRGFDVEKLADGVYAVMRREPAGLAVHANNLFIVNEDDVVVVDTSQSLALTKEIIAALRKITTKPVKFVINTHWHDDHYIGNQVYREAFPGVEFIAHAATLTDYPADGVPNRQQMKAGIPPLLAKVKELLQQNKNLAGQDLTAEERAAFESDIEWAERYLQEVPTADVILPSIAVTDRLTFTRGKRTIEIRSVGPGHSQADLIVHLPADNIVIAGDLVIWPIPLAGLKSSIGGWVTALQRIRDLKPAVIVPGHGPLMRDDAYLEQMQGVFRSLKQQVDAAVARGETLEQVRKSVDLADWRATFAAGSQLRAFLFDYYVTGPGVAAAFREAKG
jgi:glyoxylase-like metal-dependent hydrolase (beta-lactamase superfamily II)